MIGVSGFSGSLNFRYAECKQVPYRLAANVLQLRMEQTPFRLRPCAS